MPKKRPPQSCYSATRRGVLNAIRSSPRFVALMDWKDAARALRTADVALDFRPQQTAQASESLQTAAEIVYVAVVICPALAESQKILKSSTGGE